MLPLVTLVAFALLASRAPQAAASPVFPETAVTAPVLPSDGISEVPHQYRSTRSVKVTQSNLNETEHLVLARKAQALFTTTSVLQHINKTLVELQEPIHEIEEAINKTVEATKDVLNVFFGHSDGHSSPSFFDDVADFVRELLSVHLDVETVEAFLAFNRNRTASHSQN